MRQSGRICEHSFASVFAWQHFYGNEWAECHGRLIVRSRTSAPDSPSKYMILPDICTSQLPHILEMIAKDAGDTPYAIAQLSAEESEWMGQMFPDRFLWDAPRSATDYIYDVESFRTFKGKRLAAKRNHVNRFRQTYPFRYETLAPEHFGQCMLLERQWRSVQPDLTGQLLAEEEVIRVTFQHYRELGCVGGALFVYDKLVAFTYGSPLNGDTIDVHIEKADTRYEGVFPMIGQLFAQHLPGQYRFINREEDLGLPGLRQSKLSYNPCRMEQKWCARPMDSDLRGVVRIWQECFHDDRAFVDAFLSRYYRRRHLFARRENGSPVSVCLLVPCDSAIGKVGYLYGISTLEEYRRQGLADQVVREAVGYCRQQGMAAVALIPESDELSRYYTRFGFSPDRIPVTFSNEIDLGTGNPERDRAMLLRIGANGAIVDALTLTAEE